MVQKNVVIENLKKTIIDTRAYSIITSIIILIKTIILYNNAIYITKPIEATHIYTAYAFIFVIINIPILFKRKTRNIITTLINIIISSILLINEIYYTYSTNLISISQISNLKYGKEITAALPNLIKARQILYIIDIIAILAYYIYQKAKTRKKVEESKITIKEKYNCKLVIPYTIITIILLVSVMPKWIEETKKYPYNKIEQINISSIYGYHYIDILNNINMKKNLKYKSKQEMMNAYNDLKEKYNEYNLKYEYINIAKDKNVIIIQLESIQNFLVNRKINGQEITPNLNKFINENIEFTNMQNQSYSSTADSEYSVMNSVYPLENGMSFSQYPTNDYDDIYKMYKKENYITTYIHGNEGGFWNRNSVYSRLKIDNLLFDNIFEEETERINGYISDEQVYRKTIEEIKTYEDKFLVNIVAASSHIAFDLPGIENKEEKVKIDVGEEWKNTFFGNYLEAANYADYAFGIFIDELKKEGLYEDSVILVYGDHAGLQMYNYEMIDFIKQEKEINDIQTQINYSNVLCALKIPGITDTLKITKPVSKVDIKPTLTQISGIEDGFSLGVSMFSDKEFACINNGRIITDKYFFDGDWYEIETSNQIKKDEVEKEIQEKLNYYEDCLKKELDISLSINILNLLK